MLGLARMKTGCVVPVSHSFSRRLQIAQTVLIIISKIKQKLTRLADFFFLAYDIQLHSTMQPRYATEHQKIVLQEDLLTSRSEKLGYRTYQ